MATLKMTSQAMGLAHTAVTGYVGEEKKKKPTSVPLTPRATVGGAAIGGITSPTITPESEKQQSPRAVVRDIISPTAEPTTAEPEDTGWRLRASTQDYRKLGLSGAAMPSAQKRLR